MILRINIKLISWLVFAIIIAATISAYYMLSANQNSQGTPSLPADVAHALEYFNAVNYNKTILVPSQYYTLASAYSINGNRVLSDDSEYANILLNNRSYPGINFVLIDMNQLNDLQALYNTAGIAESYSITIFPSNVTFVNLTQELRNCFDYQNSTQVFAECSLYAKYNITNPLNPNQTITVNRKAGDISVATFPHNSTYSVINASVFYNGTGMQYLPSYINASESTNFEAGIMFVYEGLTTFYLPQQLMNTFYGRHMFLPNSTSNQFFDSYGEARTIKLN